MGNKFKKHHDNWLLDYIEYNIERGDFCLESKKILRDCKISPNALRQASLRLKKKGKLLVLKPGLFLPIPPEYRTLEAPPIQWFIDTYMRLRKAKYYVGLLSAAKLHGASHQAVQIFQVISEKQMRSFDIGKQRIQFIRKKNLDQFPTIQFKTE